jgi:hypothetical protein
VELFLRQDFAVLLNVCCKNSVPLRPILKRTFFFGCKLLHSYLCRPLKRPVRLRVRTPPFHGGDTSSNLVRATGFIILGEAFFMYTIYALISKNRNWICVGFSADIDDRVRRHQQGYEKTTSPYRLFTIVQRGYK